MFSKEWIITLLLTKTEQATAVANEKLKNQNNKGITRNLSEIGVKKSTNH